MAAQVKEAILVTGGGGLLGSALQPLLPGAVFLRRKDGDLADPAAVRKIFERHKPGKVIHLAARVAGVKYNAGHNADMFLANAQMNLNLLAAAQEHGAKKIVAVLSGCCFPKVADDHPLTEEDLHAGMPFRGHLGYGFAKRILDVGLHLAAEQYKIVAASITPATMFGPHDNFDLEEGHVVGSLIHKCLLAKRNGGPLKVWGTGRAVRQFVYSGDVARLLAALLDKETGPDTLVAVPDEGIAIRELVETIARVMEFKGPIEFDVNAPEGQRVRVLKSVRFEKFFPDFKFTPLPEAIRKTAEWFAAEGGNSRVKGKKR